MPLHPIARASIEAVMGPWSVTEDQILGPGRTEWVCEARFCAYKLALDKSGAPMVTVGSWFGRTHGAISGGMQTLSNLMQTNTKFAERVSAATLNMKH